MNTIKRDYRLDEIVELVKKAKFLTREDLINKTGKSRATLGRDIRLLKSICPQIKTKRGTGGGIYWEEKKGI